MMKMLMIIIMILVIFPLSIMSAVPCRKYCCNCNLRRSAFIDADYQDDFADYQDD